ncbi:MAG: carboxymuconolactone decarboxylase family protein [bacterium]
MFSEQIQDKLIDIGSMVLKTGALDNKTRSLIALSTAIVSCCSHCHGEMEAMARKFEATKEEIEEAESIALRMRKKCENKFGLVKLNA